MKNGVKTSSVIIKVKPFFRILSLVSIDICISFDNISEIQWDFLLEQIECKRFLYLEMKDKKISINFHRKSMQL